MTSRLPGILGEIEDVAGTEAALQLARERGGTEMKFSGRPGGALARIVGDTAAAKITELLGTEKYCIPMASVRGERARREAAAQLVAKGFSTAKAALTVGVHQRTVERLRSPSRSMSREPKLPGFDD